MRRRFKTWSRRLGIGAVVAVAALTVASLVFNAVTQPAQGIDPGFGQYVRVASSDVHYQQWGGGGTPIVLVPGFLESSIVWSEVGPLLGAHHSVYALDLPGHGYTRHSGPITLAAQADLVDGFIAALHLQSPLLVGHSLGAAVSGSVALRHPHDASSVVFADGDGLPIHIGPSWQRAALLDSPYMTTVVRVVDHWPEEVRKIIASSCGPHCPAATNSLAKKWMRPLHQLSDEHALHNLMLSADYGLNPKELGEIAVPTSVIWGSGDHQGGSLNSLITNLHRPPVTVIPGVGHLTMIAAPDVFAQTVEAVARPT